MKAIDDIAARIETVFERMPSFSGVGRIVREFARAARVESEMMKSDPDFFLNWPEFVTLK